MKALKETIDLKKLKKDLSEYGFSKAHINDFIFVLDGCRKEEKPNEFTISKKNVSILTGSNQYFTPPDVDTICMNGDLVQINLLPTMTTVPFSSEEAEMVSDCILMKLKEIGETEQKHARHLKDSFYEAKKKLLSIHSRVCDLIGE